MTVERNIPENYEQKFISDHEDLVERVQKLIDQYHALSAELSRVGNKIPDGMDKRIIKIELQLEQLLKDVESKFVERTEFEVLKVEHNQIKKLVWGFIMLVLTSVVGALLALVVHNASLIK